MILLPTEGAIRKHMIDTYRHVALYHSLTRRLIAAGELAPEVEEHLHDIEPEAGGKLELDQNNPLEGESTNPFEPGVLFLMSFGYDNPSLYYGKVKQGVNRHNENHHHHIMFNGKINEASEQDLKLSALDVVCCWIENRVYDPITTLDWNGIEDRIKGNTGKHREALDTIYRLIRPLGTLPDLTSVGNLNHLPRLDMDLSIHKRVVQLFSKTEEQLRVRSAYNHRYIGLNMCR